MKNIISIKNLSFFYEDNKIFDNLNLNIKENKWVTLLGNNGSGKSTIVKLILGLYKFDGEIIIDGLNLLENIEEIRKKIGIVFSDPNFSFVLDNVDDELEFSLRNLNLEESEIQKRKQEIVRELGISKLIGSNPKDLSGGEKQLVALATALAITHQQMIETLATALVIKPKILILDESLEMLDCKQKEKVVKIIKKYYKKGMTVINISQNVEDSLLGDEIIIMDNGKIILDGSKEEIFENEKRIKELGLELPFIVDLSIKLKYYGMVDKLYFDIEELIDVIWK